MKKLSIVLALLSLLIFSFVLQSCEKENPYETWNLTGIITDSDTGEPLDHGVWVTVYDCVEKKYLGYSEWEHKELESTPSDQYGKFYLHWTANSDKYWVKFSGNYANIIINGQDVCKDQCQSCEPFLATTETYLDVRLQKL